MRSRLAGLVLLAFVGGRTHAGAVDLPRMTRLADGVYMYEHADPTKAGVTANNLVVIGADAVLVADGQGTVENTGHLVAAIAAVTKTPIKYVIVGSEHGDHRGGDSAFPDTAVFIAHPSSKEALEKQAAAPVRRANAPPVVVPGETVSDSRTIDLGGGRQATVRFLGRAHTGGDLEVLLPKERIAFMSEAFISGIFPSMANGFPTEWVEVLRRAEALDADVFVPAHGVMASPSGDLEGSARGVPSGDRAGDRRRAPPARCRRGGSRRAREGAVRLANRAAPLRRERRRRARPRLP